MYLKMYDITHFACDFRFSDALRDWRHAHVHGALFPIDACACVCGVHERHAW